MRAGAAILAVAIVTRCAFSVGASPIPVSVGAPGGLEAGVMNEGTVERTVAGTPQGGVISPLLSNIYLHVLDVLWMRHSAPLGALVRYADDLW